MRVITSPSAMTAELDGVRADGTLVGLVPTMGALHAGHASLIRRAVSECGVVVVSVFVNPLQFGVRADLDTYPRRLRADAETAAEAGATYVFAPTSADMYPTGFATTVHLAGLTERLEGTMRPGHFDGVTTVVTKLLAIAGPCRAYFGEKDFQQLQVVRQLTIDLALPVTIVGCPTVREPDGLALSSRNARLTAQERCAAAVLSRALQKGAGAVGSGTRNATAIRQLMADEIGREPLAQLDYAEVVDPDTMTTPTAMVGPVRLLVAAHFGATRLIDNTAADNQPPRPARESPSSR